MKNPIYLLLFLFLLTTPSFAQKVAIGSPLYLGALLINESNLDDMEELCHYYNFTKSASEDDFTVYVSPNNEKVRFKIENKTPIVEVFTEIKLSSIEKILSHVGFRKSLKGYERGSGFSTRKTCCTILSSPKAVRFFRQ